MKRSFLFYLSLLSIVVAGCKAVDDSTNHNSSSTPKNIYTPQYTIDESFVGTTTDANNSRFSIENVEKHESILDGKTIYFLGSSVTYGSATNGVAMGEYLSALTGCFFKKEAVSGTTIQNESGKTNSYTQRLESTTQFNKEAAIDAFVCQISTNDAYNTTRLSRLGELTDENELEISNFNRNTTYGGLEFIVNYVEQTWDCPIFFYSGAYFGDGSGTRKSSAPTGTNYAKIIQAAQDVADKYNTYQDYEVYIIDLFNDEEFNAAANDSYYQWATSDAIHPKKAGYLQWWVPYFEAFLSNYFEGNI